MLNDNVGKIIKRWARIFLINLGNQHILATSFSGNDPLQDFFDIVKVSLFLPALEVFLHQNFRLLT